MVMFGPTIRTLMARAEQEEAARDTWIAESPQWAEADQEVTLTYRALIMAIAECIAGKP